MGRIKYLIGRIMNMNYGSMLETVEKIHKKTGCSRIWLFCDIVHCGLRYSAGYKDYLLCEFYNLTPEQRATYVTRGVNNQIVKLLNDPAYYHCVDDKTEFNRLFSDFIHRGWLDMTNAGFEEFRSFMENRERIISKPAAATCGPVLPGTWATGVRYVREAAGSFRAWGIALGPVACVWDQPQPPPIGGPGSVCTALHFNFWSPGCPICVGVSLPQAPSLTACILFSVLSITLGISFSPLFLSLSICPTLGQPLATSPSAQGWSAMASPWDS